MTGLIDPDEKHHTIFWLPAMIRTQVHPAEIEQSGPWPGYPDSIFVSFSFHRPLAPQIQQAVRLLEDSEKRVRKETSIRAKQIRFVPERCILYLRLLDAQSSGASVREIGRFFFPDKADSRGSAKAALRAARRMAEEGFKDLLLMAYP